MRKALIVFAIVFVLQGVLLGATAFLFHTYGGSLAHEISGQDAEGFMHLADALLADHTYHLPGNPTPETWRPPAYPALIAGVYALTNHSLMALLLVLALVGALTAALVYLIGIEFGLGERVATVVGILFGASPAVIWIPPSGMGGDILFTLFFTAALYALLRIEKSAKPLYVAAVFGALLGLATLTRPLGLYFAVPLLISVPFFVSRRDMRFAAKLFVVALFGFLIVITPWMARNEAVAGRFALSSQFAFNPFRYNIPSYLAWQNHTSLEVEQAKLMKPFGTDDYYVLTNGFTHYDELTTIDRNFLKQHFVSYVAFHLYKMIPFFVGSGVNVIYATITNEIPNMPDVPFFPRAAVNTSSLFYGGSYGAVFTNLIYFWPSTLERLVWLMLFALAFAAPFLTSGRARHFAVLGVVMIVLIALLASPIAQPRYRIPAEPFIWILAAASGSVVCSRCKTYVRPRT